MQDSTEKEGRDLKIPDRSAAGLPVIDISPFLPAEATAPTTAARRRAETVAALAAAVRGPGFFYLVGHGIPEETRAAVLAAARAFFTDGTEWAGGVSVAGGVSGAGGANGVDGAAATATAAATASATAAKSDSTRRKRAIRRQDPGVGCGDGARGYQVLGSNVTGGRRDWHEAVDWYREIVAGEGADARDLHEVAIDGEAGGGEGGGEEGADGSETRQTVAAFRPGRSPSCPHRRPPYALLQGVNLWPAHPPNFRALYEDYVGRARAVGAAVLRALGEALELQDPDVFVRATADSFWVMRAIGYPPAVGASNGGGTAGRHGNEGETAGRHANEGETAAKDGNDGDGDGDGIGCGAHTDYGCLTLLLADGTRGALQVWRPDGGDSGDHAGDHAGDYAGGHADGHADGNAAGSSSSGSSSSGRRSSNSKRGRWISADPLPGAYVVNVGDMVERWTAGLARSTRHRVVRPAATGGGGGGGGYRVSVPFFLEPALECVVAPLPECMARVRRGGRQRQRGGGGVGGGGVGGGGDTDDADGVDVAGKYPPVRYGDHLAAKVGGNFYRPGPG